MQYVLHLTAHFLLAAFNIKYSYVFSNSNSLLQAMDFYFVLFLFYRSFRPKTFLWHHTSGIKSLILLQILATSSVESHIQRELFLTSVINNWLKKKFEKLPL